MTEPWSPPPSGGAPSGPATGGAPVDEAHPAGTTAPSGSGPGAVPEPVQWRRLHKITPALNAWKVAAVLLGLLVWNYGEEFAQLPFGFAQKALVAVGLIVLGAAAGLGWSALAWSRTQYAIGRQSVYLHSGVLWRQQRHVRLDRLQAVDVTQPLLARLFGFSSLKIESAGGAGSNLTLSYLTESEAQRVRNEILARAAGVDEDDAAPSTSPEAGEAPAPAPAVAAPERPLLELSPGRLMASLVRSPAVVMGVIALAAIVAALVLTRSTRFLAGALPGVLGIGGYIWSRFAGEFSFRLGVSPDGLRLRHGLLESKARTVPPGRVQAVQLTQPLLWRRKDWWRVRMTVAGYGGEGEDSASVLYPVATRAEVEQILPLVIPDLGTDRPLEVLAAAMYGSGPDEGFHISPARVRILDPLTYRRNGLCITGTTSLIRHGRWWRSVALVPHVRSQSLGINQGPISRRFGVADLQFHVASASIPPTAAHLDADLARDLLVDLAGRARQARRQAGPERWMRRAQQPTADDAALLRSAYAGVLPSTPGRGGTA